MVEADINADFAAALAAGGFMHIRTDFNESHVDQIALFEGGGLIECVSSDDGRGGSDIQRARMQIQVRDAATGAGKEAARVRAISIISLLHRGVVTNCLSVFWDGRMSHWTDDNDRHIYAIEFKVIRSAGVVG